MDFRDLFSKNPYALSQPEKEKLFSEALAELTAFHKENCEGYARLCNVLGDGAALPVSLFKEYDLKSVPGSEIVKTITSSGTTGQRPSKIYLDAQTAKNQQLALAHIMSDFIGEKRIPMVILDSKSVFKDRNMFSARGAGILGFSIFASKSFYALGENMQLDVSGLLEFLSEHEGEPIFLFGFTFIIFEHFLRVLEEKNIKLPLQNGVLVHGGGWKKMQASAISEEEFNRRIHASCGISRIHGYYGMAEQTGSVFMECECGHLHASSFSDVVIRRPGDYSEADFGEEGVIEVRSLLPHSYPGHILLTEDLGTVLGADNCPCGRKGKYFKVKGRVPKAEVRGCSDTYER